MENEHLQQFAARLRLAAQEAGFQNPTQLAEACGSTVSATTKHWHGYIYPQFENLNRYRQVIKRSLDWLFTGKEPELPNWHELIDTIRRIAEQHKITIEMPDEATKYIFRHLQEISTQQRAAA